MRKISKLINNEELMQRFNSLYGTTRTPVIDKLKKGKCTI